MSAHSFSFEGGEILSKMGASWFVSYAYYEKVDVTHKNWDKVSTTASRISRYNEGRKYHKLWLQEVLVMNPINLNRNTLGLDASQIKTMAKAVLTKLQ